MPNLDRRKLLRAGIALAVPFGGMSLFSGCQQSTDITKNDGSPNVGETNESVAQPKQDGKEKIMQVQYLEIVTPEADALCKQYSAIHGITFSEPEANFGNARTAKLNGGGLIGIRGPLRETETPVIRPYVLVENLEEAVAAAAEAGAEIAIPSMELPGHGTIAVVIQGGIECGLWQL
jgi:predicted enzyme related to lactoylglutathione lyase